MLFRSCPEILAGLCPDEPEMLRIVKVYDVRKCGASLTLDAHEGRAVCRIRGMQD